MSIQHAQLFALLFNEQRWESLANALSQTRETLEASGEGNLWRFWQAALLAAQGDIEKADSLIQDLPDSQASDARRIFAMANARRTGNWSVPVALLTERWESTRGPSDLFNLCSVQLAAGNADFVADHAEELVQGMLTVEALRIAVSAAMQSKRWPLCLKLLDENVDLFPKKTLPSDLRRIRINAEQALGMMAEALRHAEELVTEEENAPNLDLLFQVHIRAGRLKSAILPAEKLMRLTETSAETLVRVARVMRLEDPALASAALRTAVERGVSGPETVSAAYLLAHELGSEELISSLHLKFSEEAQTPNPYLQLGDLNMAIEALRLSRENAQEAMTAWRRGRIPVHFLRRGVRVPLAWWPIQALEAPEADAIIRPHSPVFFRHGARASLPVPRTIRRLYADVTSLLNAYELGILFQIEEAFGALYLPPALRTSLVQQLDDVTGGQPDVEAGHRIVAKLLDEGKIETWNSPVKPVTASEKQVETKAERSLALAAARQRGGILVGYWQRGLPEGDITPEERPSLASAADIVTVLRELGRINEKVAHTAEQKLTEASQLSGDSSRLRVGQSLLLDGIMAELLARAGILESAAETFNLVIPAHIAAWIHNEIQKQKGQERVRARLNELLEYLRLKSKAVDFPLRQEFTTHDELSRGDAAELCLEQLLQAAPGDGNWVWFDDRHVNAYERCGEVPIISTLGVVEELRRLSRISETEYFNLRHRLRAADFRFIPLTEDELTYHLQWAQVSDGILVETPELVVLRRYFALTLLDKGTLQWPPLDFDTPKPQGEIGFLMDAMQKVADSLVVVFGKSDATNETKVARADWLRRWLWLPPDITKALFTPSTTPNEDNSIGTRSLAGIGDIILLAKAINRTAFSPIETRAQYLTWLETTLLPDEARQQAAAEQIRATLEGKVLKLGKNKLERDVNAAVLCDWYLALPYSLRRRVNLTPITRSRLGLDLGQSITVGTDSFEITKFWEAAEAALSGKPTSVETVDKRQVFTFISEQEPDDVPTLYLRNERQKQQSRIKDDLLILLDSNPLKRIEVLERHPEWLDSPIAKDVHEKERIARLPNTVSRVHKVEESRSKSAWHLYQNLERSFGQQPGPSLETMAPPEVEVLRHFLRLRPTDEMLTAAQIDASARRMIKNLGVVETIRRLALMPRDLPDKVVNAFDLLPEAEQESTISHLSNAAQHPLARAQAVRLSVRLEKSTDALAIARSILTEEAATATDAFLRVLRWSWNQLGLPPHAGTVRPAERLLFSWVHAGQLFKFVQAISAPSTIVAFFAKYENTPRSEFLAAPPDEEDVAWAGQVVAKQLLISAVGSALGAEGSKASVIASEIRPIADEWCFQRQDDLRWPHLPWLHDPSLFTNVIDSFLGKPRDQLLRPIFDETLALEFSSPRLFREMEALMAALEEEPGADAPWILLGALLRGQQSPPALRERLRIFLERIDISELNLSEIARQTAVLVFAAQAWKLGGPELSSRAKTQVAKLAGWFAEQSVSPTEEKRRQHLVVQAAQALARPAPEEEGSRLFAETTLTALDAWPAIILRLADACDILVSLPPAQQPAVAALLTRIRLDAKRIERNDSTTAPLAS